MTGIPVSRRISHTRSGMGRMRRDLQDSTGVESRALWNLSVELLEPDNCCRRRRTGRCAARRFESWILSFASLVAYLPINHFGPERDNRMVSKFTPTVDAFEHRAPYRIQVRQACYLSSND